MLYSSPTFLNWPKLLKNAYLWGLGHSGKCFLCLIDTFGSRDPEVFLSGLGCGWTEQPSSCERKDSDEAPWSPVGGEASSPPHVGPHHVGVRHPGAPASEPLTQKKGVQPLREGRLSQTVSPRRGGYTGCAPALVEEAGHRGEVHEPKCPQASHSYNAEPVQIEPRNSHCYLISPTRQFASLHERLGN